MEDRRGFGWAIVLAPVVLSLLIVVPARADLLVHRLQGDAQAADPASTPCCIADECATVPAEKAVEATEAADASKVSLFVLTTVLFSNPDDTTPPGSSTSGGPTTSGGPSPPPTSHAPEPATVISAFVGVCLAAFYVVLRRKRLAASVT